MTLKPIAAALALSLALFTAPAAAQQDNEQMRAMIAQLRQTAAQMKGQLPQADIDEMLAQAAELERENSRGAFTAPPTQPDPADVTARLMREHGGVVDWLTRETACAGYEWETYKIYRLDTGDRDAQRDPLCQRAYAHFADYVRLAREGHTPQARAALEAYDEAAHEAVAFYERR